MTDDRPDLDEFGSHSTFGSSDDFWQGFIIALTLGTIFWLSLAVGLGCSV